MKDELAALVGGESPLAALIGNLDERPCKRVPIPGRANQVGLWALTVGETEMARKTAYSWVRDSLKFGELELAWDEQRAINDSVVIATLATALRDPEKPIDQWVKDHNELRQRLTHGQVTYLWTEYLQWLSESDWTKHVEDVEKDLASMVDLVGKGFPIATRLSYYDTLSLRQLLHTAVGQLASAATERSSGTSSPSGSLAPSGA